MIIDISGSGLAAQPFAHVALMQAGLLRQFGWGDCHAVRHLLVESEAIAEQYAGAAKRDAEVADQLADECVQFLKIWFTHASLLCRWVVVVVVVKSVRRASGQPGRRHRLRPAQIVPAHAVQQPWRRRSCPALMSRTPFVDRRDSDPVDGPRGISARSGSEAGNR